jgi:signal peptidase
MSAPPFALPAPDPRDQPAGPEPVAVSGRARARALAAAGALGAAATAATLAIASGIAVFERDVVEVIERPASVTEEVTVRALRDLAGLPGPSLPIVAALAPAVALLVLAVVLRRLGSGAPALHGVSPEALGAAERTMSWAVRVIAVGALLVFVVPALLQLIGVRTVSLTTGSMAPAYPAGSILFVVAPSDPGGIRAGDVVVVARADGLRVTHRVVALVRGESGEVTGLRTRGDAAPAPDPEPVSPGAVDGVVVAGVPVLGALRAWMASTLGIAIGLVLAWAFAMLGVLLADDRRRALAARTTG